ncbi:MAG: transglycosylase domain-containing protein [Eubacteriaceae bacterium]|jgi:penicillin-binding protein 1A
MNSEQIRAKETTAQKQNSRNRKNGKNDPGSRGRRIGKIILWIILILFIVLAAGVAYLYSQVQELDMSGFTYDENAQIYDVSGNPYQSLQGSEIRDTVSITEIPPVLRSAFISIEDQRFYSHHGVDIKGIGRAVLGVVTTGSLEGAGGSTITQQLIKLTQLTTDKTITRKFNEWVLASRLERIWTKDQILEAYLNKINLSGVYGVKEAARQYFNEDITQMTAAQSAILAAIPKSPSYYDPYSYDEGGAIITDANGNAVLNPVNKERAKLVLAKMEELGYLNADEHQQALTDLDNGAGLVYVNLTETYSYFTDSVYAQLLTDLESKYNYSEEEAAAYIQKAGLRVYSTVEPEVQNTLEKAAKDDDLYPGQSSEAARASELTGTDYSPQVGMTVIDNSTGAVAGIVGGREDKTNLSLNRAERKFQTGSSTKPLTAYGPALDTKKVTLATVFNDVPIDWSGWRPNNASNTFSGPLTVREGLSGSINTIAAQVVAETGINTCADYATKLGLTLTDEDRSGGALALGGYSEGQTPLAMAAAFSVFPKGGTYTQPYFYTRVEDSDGNVILEHSAGTSRVFSADTSYLITDTLKEAIQGQTTNISVSGTEAAGKTGTTDNNMHAWFCGYTPDYSMAVWYGYDENNVQTSEGDIVLNIGISGGSKPGPASMFEYVMNRLPVKTASFTIPSDLVKADIDQSSGKLADELTDQDSRGSQRRTEYFTPGTVPSDKDDVHTVVEVDTSTGMLRSSGCPSKLTAQKVVLDLSKIKYPSGIVPVNGTWVPDSLNGIALSTLSTCTVHSGTASSAAGSASSQTTSGATGN